jgi:peptidoglycan/LPS O-acetylase OafA/YrhL
LAPLDGLRGIASLIVLVLHYRFVTDKWNDTFVHTNPFWDQLILVYKFGWLAVEFFFVLSGFIFFWKYGQLISDQAISLTKFAVLRLTRLYPLHVTTLFLVIPLQWLIYQKSGTTFFYANNDLYHLGLNLVFLNYGWFESGFSFNAPSWSIALEVSLYFLFYVVCFGRRNRTLIALGLFLFFLTLNIKGPIANLPFMNEHFGRVGYCFFMGGLLHYFYTKIQPMGRLARIVGVLAPIPVVVILGSIHYFFMGHPGMAQITGARFNTLIILGVFPALIAAALLQPTLSKLLGSPTLRFFGDISYSMYMIHFSILMIFHYISITSTAGPIDFLKKGVFWTYMSVVIGVSTLSYRYFEKPAMEKLRELWRNGPKARIQPVQAVQEEAAAPVG